MSKNLGTSVTDAIVPQGLNATHYDDFGQVGFRSVATLADRDGIAFEAGVLDSDGISSGRRKAGMVVKVLEDGEIYSLDIPNFTSLSDADKLVALADNSHWVIAQFGSDVTKAYVDAADANLQTQINNLPTGTQVYQAGSGANSIVPVAGNNAASADSAVVAGGSNNQAQSPNNAVLGGYGNTAGGGTSITVGGGYGNIAQGEYDTIAGGQYNFSIGAGNFIGGGGGNRHLYSNRAFIGGGNANVINGGSNASLVGGYNNTITGGSSFLGNGESNNGGSGWGFLGGGTYNATLSNTTWAAVVCGNNNKAHANYSFVSNGYNNTANGQHAHILGGESNTVNGLNCHAYGCSNSIIGSGCSNVVFINCHDFSADNVTDKTYFNNAEIVAGATPDVTKAYVDAADATKAPLASPVFTGTPTAPTQTSTDTSTKLATTAFAQTLNTNTLNRVNGGYVASHSGTLFQPYASLTSALASQNSNSVIYMQQAYELLSSTPFQIDGGTFNMAGNTMACGGNITLNPGTRLNGGTLYRNGGNGTIYTSSSGGGSGRAFGEIIVRGLRTNHSVIVAAGTKLILDDVTFVEGGFYGTPTISYSGTLVIQSNCDLTGVNLVDAGGGTLDDRRFITRSPNGTRYRLQVSDAGVVSAIAV